MAENSPHADGVRGEAADVRQVPFGCLFSVRLATQRCDERRILVKRKSESAQRMREGTSCRGGAV